MASLRAEVALVQELREELEKKKRQLAIMEDNQSALVVRCEKMEKEKELIEAQLKDAVSGHLQYTPPLIC